LDAAGVDYRIVVSEEPAQIEAYRNSFGRERVIVAQDCFDLGSVREFTRKFVKTGEWALHIDDDMTGFTRVDDEFYGLDIAPVPETDNRPWYAIMNRAVPFPEWQQTVIVESIGKAMDEGANIVAIAPLANQFFRRVKWGRVGFTRGWVLALRNVGLHWAQNNGHTMEDWYLGVAHLLAHGRVLINRFAHVETKHYAPGGEGTYAERVERKKAAVADIVRRFPGAVMPFNRRNSEPAAELRLRFSTLEQVDAWRQKMRVVGLKPLLTD
jgi:hypothetical protein